MATEFKLPALGENVESGDIIKILVSPGDKVDQDQAVLELETDKAAIEVPSSVTGVVSAVHVKEGEKASVGQVIFSVEPGRDGAPAADEARASQEKQASVEAAGRDGVPSRALGGRTPAQSGRAGPRAATAAESGTRPR